MVYAAPRRVMNSDTCRKPPLGTFKCISNPMNSGARKRTEAYCFTSFIYLLQMTGSWATSAASYQRALDKGDEATHSPRSWETKGPCKLLAPLKRVSVILSPRRVFREKGVTRTTQGKKGVGSRLSGGTGEGCVGHTHARVPSHAHMILEWVLRSLVGCQRAPGGRTVSEGARGPGALSPVSPSASAGGHERRVVELAQLVRRIGRCAVQDCRFPRGPGALGHARMVPPVAARGRGSTLRSRGLQSAPPSRGPSTTPPCSTSTRGRGAVRGAPRPRSPSRLSLPQLPPPRPPTSWRAPWRPQRPPHIFGEQWQLSRRKEHPLVSRYVCWLAG